MSIWQQSIHDDEESSIKKKYKWKLNSKIYISYLIKYCQEIGPPYSTRASTHCPSYFIQGQYQPLTLIA